ncbi:hypothetical protein, partial [Methylomagnum sp.]
LGLSHAIPRGCQGRIWRFLEDDSLARRPSSIFVRLLHNSELPDTEQNELARRILADLESERRWDVLFEQSQELLAQLAEEALAEHRAGRTKILNSNNKRNLDLN